MLHTYATVTKMLTRMFSLNNIISTANTIVRPVIISTNAGVTLKFSLAYLPVQNRNA